MTAEMMGAWASVGTLVVVVATAVAAFVQLRHMSVSNGLAALNEFRKEYERIEAVAFAELPTFAAHLADPAQRRRIAADGLVPDWAHAAMPMMRLLEILGGYTNRKIVSHEMVCDLWAPVVVLWWNRFAPFIAVMRRTSGPTLYENWESIAVRSQRWLAEERSTYPKRLPRIGLIDPWAAHDVAAPAASTP